MKNVLLVGCGGFLGALARYGLSQFSWSVFPVSTLLINLSGSCAMGFLLNYFQEHPYFSTIVLFGATGFLGAFTTFSTFSYETVALLKRGDTLLAVAYVAASVALCLLGVALGQWIAHLR